MLISNTGPNIWGNIKLKYIPQLIRPKLIKEPWATLYVEPFGRDQEVGGGRKQKGLEEVWNRSSIDGENNGNQIAEGVGSRGEQM